jgi:hypothetical protein
MLFNPGVKRVAYFSNVAFATGTFYSVYSFGIMLVKLVLNRSHFLFDGIKWFE